MDQAMYFQLFLLYTVNENNDYDIGTNLEILSADPRFFILQI